MYSSDDDPAERKNRENTERNDPNETQRTDFFKGFQHENSEQKDIINLLSTMKEEGMKEQLTEEIALGLDI